MLTRLTPEQVSAHWPDIKATLQYNLLPTSNGGPDGLNHILEQILSGGMQVWAAIQDGDIAALCITMFSTETGTDTRNLLIYSVYGYSFIKPEIWQEGLKSLRKFAKAKGCHEIVAFTKVARVITVAKELGGNVDYRLIKLEV